MFYRVGGASSSEGSYPPNSGFIIQGFLPNTHLPIAKLNLRFLKMKFSTALLPLLTVTAKENKIKSDERWYEPHEFRKQCSEFIPSFSGKKGTFEVTGSGTHSGQIKLENYGNTIRCKQVITADDSCEAIEIRYTSIALEEAIDFAQFSYNGPNGMKLSPQIEECQGAGCQHEDFGGEPGGRNVFFVNSNSFTFYFHADSSIRGGDLIFDWNCIDDYATTTTTTTTRGSTTTGTTTTTTTTIPPWHPGLMDYGTTTTT